MESKARAAVAPRLGFIGALAAGGAIWFPLHAQDTCSTGRISEIFVNNQSVFDTSEMEEDASFLWLFDFANWVHMRTRAGFVEAELLFRVGDCLDEQLLVESERLLRNHEFIAHAEVIPVPMRDGTFHVVVNTRDEWTLELSLRARFEEGFEFTGIDLTEENLLGHGATISVFFRQRREDRQVGLGLSTVRFLGTRWDAAIRGGETRVGPFFSQSFLYPFVGEVGRISALQAYSVAEDLFAYSLENDPEFSNVVLPFRDQRFELTAAGRLGRAGRLAVVGGGISYEDLEFTGLESGVETVRDRNFGEREPASQEIVDVVSRQLTEHAVGRLNFILGARLLEFTPRRGLDALTGVHDVATGAEAALVLGRSLRFLTPDREGEPSDLFGRTRLFLGLAPGPFVFNGTASLEGRRVYESPTGTEGWRDVIAEGDVYAYWQPRAGHTVFGRVSAASAWKVDVPFQLTLGGSQGVRGYSLDRWPGGQRLLVSLEDRIYLGSPGGQAFDLGMTVFGDAGRVWAGDAPFGSDTGWLASVGAGLRIGFPSGTRGVVRLDVAVPVNGEDAFSSPTFRITAGEFLGLLNGFEDIQVRRSQRSRIGRSLLPNPSAGR